MRLYVGHNNEEKAIELGVENAIAHGMARVVKGYSHDDGTVSYYVESWKGWNGSDISRVVAVIGKTGVVAKVM